MTTSVPLDKRYRNGAGETYCVTGTLPGLSSPSPLVTVEKANQVVLKYSNDFERMSQRLSVLEDERQMEKQDKAQFEFLRYGSDFVRYCQNHILPDMLKEEMVSEQKKETKAQEKEQEKNETTLQQKQKKKKEKKKSQKKTSEIKQPTMDFEYFLNGYLMNDLSNKINYSNLLGKTNPSSSDLWLATSHHSSSSSSSSSSPRTPVLWGVDGFVMIKALVTHIIQKTKQNIFVIGGKSSFALQLLNFCIKDGLNYGFSNASRSAKTRIVFVDFDYMKEIKDEVLIVLDLNEIEIENIVHKDGLPVVFHIQSTLQLSHFFIYGQAITSQIAFYPSSDQFEDINQSSPIFNTVFDSVSKAIGLSSRDELIALFDIPAERNARFHGIDHDLEKQMGTQEINQLLSCLDAIGKNKNIDPRKSSLISLINFTVKRLQSE